MQVIEESANYLEVCNSRARAGGFVDSTDFGIRPSIVKSAIEVHCTWGNTVNSESHLANSAHEFHGNQQYSVTAITNSSAGVVERYAYQAYGEPTILDASASVLSSSSISNRYTYTGREWDATIGLYHFRARWMSGLTGRFLTRDPIKYRGGIDLYEYCDGSVLTNTDPKGLCGRWPLCGGQPHDSRFNCCENNVLVPLVSIWRCVVDNPVAHCLDYIPGILTCPFGWRFRHSYVCMDGPNQDCYSAYGDGFWGPYDPDNSDNGGPGPCNEVKVCPAQKERYETPMMPWPYNGLSQNCHHQSGNAGLGCTWFW